MIKFGTLLKPHGLKGEFKFYSDSHFINERVKKNSQLYLKINDELMAVCVEYAYVNSLPYRIKFKEYNSLTEIEKFKNIDIFVEEYQLDSSDEFLYSDLIGCFVYDQNAIFKGKVSEIVELPNQILLRVVNENSHSLIPFSLKLVPEVDILNKKIIVNWIDGL